jgi:hypothetical protein
MRTMVMWKNVLTSVLLINVKNKIKDDDGCLGSFCRAVGRFLEAQEPLQRGCSYRPLPYDGSYWSGTYLTSSRSLSHE